MRSDLRLTLLVVTTLGLGIGATTAVFSVVDATILHPLPFPEADRLVEVWAKATDSPARVPRLKLDVLTGLRSLSSVFRDVQAYEFGAGVITGLSEARMAALSRVSPGLFPMLGVTARPGRLFTLDDAAAGSGGAVLISERLWQSAMGGRVDVIGRRIWIDDAPHVVVGVLPSTFRFPEQSTDVWLPLPAHAGEPVTAQVIARLVPGVTPAGADERLRIASTGLRAAGLLAPNRDLVTNELLQRRYNRRFATGMYLLLGGVGALLLVACLNVSNLLLMRSAARERDLAVAAALGASRSDLVWQVMTEAFVLAGCGSLLGLLTAACGLRGLAGVLPDEFTFLAPAAVAIDDRVIVFAALTGGLTCLLVGVLPAIRAGRADLVPLLNRVGRTHSAASQRWHAGLVVAQLALAIVVLSAGGLLLRSFARLIRVDPGFETGHLLVVELQLPEHRYPTLDSQLALISEIDRRAQSMQQVVAATYSGGAPPGGGSLSFDIHPQALGDAPAPGFEGVLLPHQTVAPDYFQTMGIRLIRGRTFRAGDPPASIIVNDVLARRLWGRSSPVGQMFRLDSSDPWHVVVGVANDVKATGLDDPFGAGMELYYPYHGEHGDGNFYAVIVRVSHDEAATLRELRRTIARLDPQLPVLGAQSMEQRLRESVSKPRFFLMLIATLGALVAGLAAVGVYGTASYWVIRQRRGLAVRIALGAEPGRVVRLVLHRGLVLAAIGAGMGLAAALAATRLLRSMLFQVTPGDPVTFASVTLALALLVLGACAWPALQASRIDPATALRSE